MRATGAVVQRDGAGCPVGAAAGIGQSFNAKENNIYPESVYTYRSEAMRIYTNIYNTVDQEAGSLESAQMEMYTMKQASQFKDNLSCRI